MRITGVGQYVAVMVDSRSDNVGELGHEVEELGLEGGEMVFFAPSEIYFKDIEDEHTYVMVRPQDIYGIVTDE